MGRLRYGFARWGGARLQVALVVLTVAAGCAPTRLPVVVPSEEAAFWVENNAETYGFRVSVPGNWVQGFFDPEWEKSLENGLGGDGKPLAEKGEKAPPSIYSTPRFVAADVVEGKLAALFVVYEVPVEATQPPRDIAGEIEGGLIWSPLVEKPFVRTETQMVAGAARQLRYRVDLPVAENRHIRLQAVELILNRPPSTFVLLCLAPDGFFKRYVPLFNRILDTFSWVPSTSS